LPANRPSSTSFRNIERVRRLIQHGGALNSITPIGGATANLFKSNSRMDAMIFSCLIGKAKSHLEHAVTWTEEA
jgi:hypothetical protein